MLSDWAATQQFLDGLQVRFALAGIVVLALSLVGGVFLSRHLSRPLPASPRRPPRLPPAT